MKEIRLGIRLRVPGTPHYRPETPIKLLKKALVKETEFFANPAQSGRKSA